MPRRSASWLTSHGLFLLTHPRTICPGGTTHNSLGPPYINLVESLFDCGSFISDYSRLCHIDISYPENACLHCVTFWYLILLLLWIHHVTICQSQETSCLLMDPLKALLIAGLHSTFFYLPFSADPWGHCCFSAVWEDNVWSFPSQILV